MGVDIGIITIIKKIYTKMRRFGFLCAKDLWCVEPFECESEKLKSSVVLRMDDGIYRT